MRSVLASATNLPLTSKGKSLAFFFSFRIPAFINQLFGKSFLRRTNSLHHSK